MMDLVRVDVGCPGTVVLVNPENRRQYSIENRCRCGTGRNLAENDPSEMPHTYASPEEAKAARAAIMAAIDTGIQADTVVTVTGLKLPAGVLDEVKRLAATEGHTENEQIARLLRRGLAKFDKER